VGVGYRPKSMPRITISYRRSDSAGTTGRIYDRLANHYGRDSVFVDIDAIPFGVDFREHIDDALKKTEFLLVVIGPEWLGPREDGSKRIHDENDPVRVEVETALRNAVKVVPLLVDGATMPTPSALPEQLRKLSFLNAAEISSNRDFDHHINRLINFLDNVTVEKQPARPQRTLFAALIASALIIVGVYWAVGRYRGGERLVAATGPSTPVRIATSVRHAAPEKARHTPIPKSRPVAQQTSMPAASSVATPTPRVVYLRPTSRAFVSTETDSRQPRRFS
jgi:hypothetical protein